MPVIASMIDELQDYRQAREALTALQNHVDEPAIWAHVLDPADMTPPCLEDVIATLCRQAKAAQQLASAAEALCAALVGECQHCAE